MKFVVANLYRVSRRRPEVFCRLPHFSQGVYQRARIPERDMTKRDNSQSSTRTQTTSRRRYLGGVGSAIGLALAGNIEMVAASHEDGFRDVSPLLEIIAEANWGRWGPYDELGAINFLGSKEMFSGLTAAMQRGRNNIERYTLQTPMTGFAVDALVGEGSFPTTDTGDPQFPGRLPSRRDNTGDAVTNPESTPSGASVADDRFVTPIETQGTTHYDALAHQWYDGKLYNGFDPQSTHTKRAYDFGVEGCPGDAVTETFGLEKADISAAAGSGVAGRGVLLDVGRHREDGAPFRLPQGYGVTLEDILETADAQGVSLQERDILLIRTGAIERVRDSDAQWVALDEPGLTYSDDLVRWVRDMEIPIIGADNLGIERFFQSVSEDDLDPERTDLHGDYVIPLHVAFLRDLGVTIHELVRLQALAEQAAEDGIYEFFYSAAPLHIEMATGGPVNPVVLKATG